MKVGLMFGFCLAAVLAGSDSVSSEFRVLMEADIDQATREEGWEKVGLAEENAQIELTFLLKQTNLQGSTPSHYLTPNIISFMLFIDIYRTCSHCYGCVRPSF
jgi:hypothetical protein